MERPLGEIYALRDQMDGSSGSIMDNSAESFGEGTASCEIFLGYAKRSCKELQSQLIRSKRQRVDP
ncbi:MAG: four helix bundle protein [Leeuwenhoekiella sp.]